MASPAVDCLARGWAMARGQRRRSAPFGPTAALCDRVGRLASPLVSEQCQRRRVGSARGSLGPQDEAGPVCRHASGRTSGRAGQAGREGGPANPLGGRQKLVNGASILAQSRRTIGPRSRQGVLAASPTGPSRRRTGPGGPTVPQFEPDPAPGRPQGYQLSRFPIVKKNGVKIGSQPPPTPSQAVSQVRTAQRTCGQIKVRICTLLHNWL